MVKNKPTLTGSQIWSMSLGFLGIQFGFALQNANASFILQKFGADIEHLSWFWLAAPLTGMIVQPIIGHYSDKTWGRLGRRRPYFLFGAIFASIALALMPNAGLFALAIPPMFIGAGFLMIMDASINVSMEPFRALVGDLLPSEQRTYGYSVQSVLIGIGAVVGSGLPYAMANWFGIDSTSTKASPVPDNVIFSFYVGAIILIVTILWTVIRTKEYSPEEMKSYQEEEEVKEPHTAGLVQIFKDFGNMPKTMRQLGLVQFFSWFALFSMWVFTTPAIANHIYGLPVEDTASDRYNDAGAWVGILFMIYNGVAAIYALILPKLAHLTSRKIAHSFSLALGGLGMVSMYFMHNQYLLILSMVGVGIAWASILAMPYAILAGSVPVKKMGIYMGIFNFFIVFPQIINGIFGGPMVKSFYDSKAIYALVMAGISLFIAAIVIHFVTDKDDVRSEL
ncbi:MAG: SLC45 family MFS transporter [Bacteroidales bacterium]|nr:SLC45 family MFS transporter [Bacteroidales bacterium]